MVGLVKKNAIILLFLSLFLASCAAQPTATPVPPATSIAQLVPTTAPQTSGSEPTAPSQPTTGPALATATAVAQLAPTATAEPTPVLAQALLESNATAVGAGDPTVIAIVLADVVNLYGVEFHLRYNPKLVEIVDADTSLPGVQITPGPAFTSGKGFVALNHVDMTEGTIDLAATRLNPAPALFGRAVVASFSAKPLAAGELHLTYDQVLLADRNGNPMRVQDHEIRLAVQP